MKIIKTLEFLGIVMFSACSPVREAEIKGIVLADNNPVPGALVRVQTTENHTYTDNEGKFILEYILSTNPVFITAWASGYYIGGVEVKLGDEHVEIHLHHHPADDNPVYEWLSSTYHPGQGENQGCSECHSREGTDIGYTLPVDEWLLDSHSKSAVNPRFLTMYNGTDMLGNQSPATRYASSRDYGTFPLRPDPDEPYFGPGYKLDFPETTGNCAACHTPAASVDNPYGVDPTTLTGIPAEGIPCDFCHKIWDVYLDPKTQVPFPNMPGVLSFEFRRPLAGHQFFAGPYDDVAPGEDTYSPLQEQSQICAPCHFGIFWDTLVYNSFGEWLESPYSNPKSGQTCQDCHMPPLGNTHFARPDSGGLKRDPATIFSHRMPGAAEVELLQNALSMDVGVERIQEQVIITVTITNDKTGHHVPTDSPLRQVILLVSATDSAGKPLTQVGGSHVPDWGGVGEPTAGYYAGLPGTGYAKILQELWTDVSPTGAYWNPTRILSDNRIPALGSDTTSYVFNAPQETGINPIHIRVDLIFRRAFIQLMDWKKWDQPDIIMEQEFLMLP